MDARTDVYALGGDALLLPDRPRPVRARHRGRRPPGSPAGAAAQAQGPAARPPERPRPSDRDGDGEVQGRPLRELRRPAVGRRSGRARSLDEARRRGHGARLAATRGRRVRRSGGHGPRVGDRRSAGETAAVSAAAMAAAPGPTPTVTSPPGEPPSDASPGQPSAEPPAEPPPQSAVAEAPGGGPHPPESVDGCSSARSWSRSSRSSPCWQLSSPRAAAAAARPPGTTRARPSTSPSRARPRYRPRSRRRARARPSVTIDGTKVCWAFTLRGVDHPNAAHIHNGGPTVSGPVVVPLGAAFAQSGCTTAPSNVTDAILASPATYYVNVHSQKYPDGAVRGQLVGGGSTVGPTGSTSQHVVGIAGIVPNGIFKSCTIQPTPTGGRRADRGVRPAGQLAELLSGSAPALDLHDHRRAAQGLQRPTGGCRSRHELRQVRPDVLGRRGTLGPPRRLRPSPAGDASATSTATTP